MTPTPTSGTLFPTPAVNLTSDETQLVAAPSTDQNPPPTANTSSQDVGNKRKPSRPPSNVWAHFSKDKENDKVIWNYCGKSYASNSASHGTTNLIKHLRACKKNLHKEEDKKQKQLLLENKVRMTLWQWSL